MDGMGGGRVAASVAAIDASISAESSLYERRAQRGGHRRAKDAITNCFLGAWRAVSGCEVLLKMRRLQAKREGQLLLSSAPSRCFWVAGKQERTTSSIRSSPDLSEGYRDCLRRDTSDENAVGSARESCSGAALLWKCRGV